MCKAHDLYLDIGVNNQNKQMFEELLADYFEMAKEDGNHGETHDMEHDGDNQIIEDSSDNGQVHDNGDGQEDRVLIQFIPDENAPNGSWYKRVGVDSAGDVDTEAIDDVDSTNDDSSESDDQVDSYLVQFVPDETALDGSGHRKVVMTE